MNKINSFCIHNFQFFQFTPEKLNSCIIKCTIMLGYEEGNTFTVAKFGQTDMTLQYEIRDEELVKFLSKSTNGKDQMLDFTFNDLVLYIKRQLRAEYGTMRCANWANQD